ncbi:MAG: PqqD family protein [Clostridia bacterium]|nr:PqqD family protein [Clostridia bacterium]MBQ2694874.1 PqqD family protein [Clostridia bacterium]
MENKKYSIKQGFVVREIAGEYIAVPVDSSCGTNIVVLNPVSKFLWEELKEEKSFDELLDAMLKNYDVSKEEAESDLKDFLMQLIENGLFN